MEGLSSSNELHDHFYLVSQLKNETNLKAKQLKEHIILNRKNDSWRGKIWFIVFEMIDGEGKFGLLCLKIGCSQIMIPTSNNELMIKDIYSLLQDMST
jgi:hypothetical protein